MMKNTNKVLIALGAGMAIGVLLGVLFAPHKGKKTRKKFNAQGRKFADDVKSKFHEGKEKLNVLKDNIEQVLKENLEEILE